jgi:uncharacterized protein YfdQ (DUF2303 family)
MFDKDAIQALTKAEAITAAAEAVTRQAQLLAPLPNDFTLHDLEKFQEHRRRARGTMASSSVNDFAAYSLAHAEAGASAFVDPERMTAVAVLNLGTPLQPGHGDNLAKLQPKRTAAYAAVSTIATGAGLKQTQAAEFLEDWPGNVECFNADGVISLPRAIAAIRKITIDSMRKLESEEKSLGAVRSAFESVQATSTEPMPTTINFACVPYHGLAPRKFVLRLGVQTGGDKPAITLRVVNQEQHNEEMALELASLVRGALQDSIPVLVGSYGAGA